MKLKLGGFKKLNFRSDKIVANLDEMWSAWHLVTAEADKYLETVTMDVLESYFSKGDKQFSESIGTKLRRNIYHYWYHIGEARTIRELLGHTGLPEYVGDMSLAAYQQEILQNPKTPTVLT